MDGVISILRPSESIEPQSITSSPKVSPIKENAEIFIIISAQDKAEEMYQGSDNVRQDMDK